MKQQRIAKKPVRSTRRADEDKRDRPATDRPEIRKDIRQVWWPDA